MTHRTLKQNLKRWIKPYHFRKKKYRVGEKLVTFKTLAHSKNIDSVIQQIHKLDTEINYYTRKIGQGKMMGGLEVTKHGKPAMKERIAKRWLWILAD